jgi:putative transposase
MHADFCVDALREAIGKYAPQDIMNADLGRQFTRAARITTLTGSDVRGSIDGRLRCMNNMLALPACGSSNACGAP